MSLWLTTVYWNRPQFILLRQAAGCGSQANPPASSPWLGDREGQRRQLKVRTELGQLKLSAVARAFTSSSWACTCWVWAPASHLHQGFHSWPQQSPFWSKLILQSVVLVPASGPYDWTKIRLFRETELFHRNVCSYLRDQGLVQLMKPLCYLCNVLQGWYLQRMMDLSSGEECVCFHMFLQFSSSFVTGPILEHALQSCQPVPAHTFPQGEMSRWKTLTPILPAHHWVPAVMHRLLLSTEPSPTWCLFPHAGMWGEWTEGWE